MHARLVLLAALIAATAAVAQPNLTFMDKPGWYAPVVPRADATATWTVVPAPLSLVGDSPSTWFNAVCYNDGDSTAMPSLMIVQVDGATVCNHNLWTIAPGGYNGWNNDGAHTVRGGRHTVVAICDASDTVTELDETDNAHVRQWIWGPATLPLQNVVTRAAPPLYDAGFEHGDQPWWNCDGVRIEPVSDRPWNAVWMEPLADEAVYYCLRLHPQAAGPEDGFGYNFASSFLTPNEQLDVILINALNVTDPAYDLGVLNFDAADGTVDYRIDHVGSSPYPFDFGIFPESPYFVSRVMTFDLSVSSGDLGPASLVAVTDPADGPVQLGWLAPDFEAGSLDDVQDVVTTGERGWVVLNLDLTQTGRHGVVGWGDRLTHPGGLAVRVGLFHARPDLQPVTLSGWHAPLVPRPTDDALLFSCPEPDTLHGNGPFTYMNLACLNGGSADADTVSFALRVDGSFLVGNRSFTSVPPGHPRVLLNWENGFADEPWTVRGGRHTLSYRLDYLEELAELLEVNNLSGRQYCWSPQVLPLGGTLTRDAVPSREGGHADCEPTVTVYPNCDGLRLQYADLGDVGKWRVAAVMPETDTRDVDLELHQPLQGTSDGFGPHRVASSTSPAGEVEFALFCYRLAAPTPYDVGVLDGEGNGGHGYTAQDELSDYLAQPDGGELGPFTILGGRMIELHEMWLPAGDLALRVDDLGGGVDWGLSVYRADQAFHDKTATVTGGYGNAAGAGGSEWVHVDVPTAGHHCVAVWKARSGDLATTAPYRLWLTYGATAAPGEVPSATRLVGAAPNPFNPRTEIAFELVGGGPCELVIHDLQGRAVRTLVRGERPAGRHEVVFDGRDDRGRRLASGVYLARLTADGVRDFQKLTLVK